MAERQQLINAIEIIYYKLAPNATTGFEFENSSSGCIRMSNVPTLLEVFIYNSDTLDYFRYFDKGDMIINCICQNTKEASRSRA